MVKVAFTENLQRHVPCPPVEVRAGTVGEALEQVFDQNPRLRGYVVDEHGALRKHVVVFADGEQIVDRVTLKDPLDANGEVYVMQALSGG